MPEGTWYLGAEGPQQPVPITATAATPTGQAEPTANVTVTEVEFAFDGLGGSIPAGPQT